MKAILALLLTWVFVIGGERRASADTVRLAFSSLTTSHAGFFTAIDEGLFKKKGIDVLQTGGMTEIMGALASRRLDGAMLVSIYALKAQELGFKELVDLAALDVRFPQAVVLTTKEFVRDRRGLVKSFMESYMEGLQLFLKDERVGKKSLARFTGMKEEKLLDVDYRLYGQKYLNKTALTYEETLSIVMERIGVKSKQEREDLFKGLVDNSLLLEIGPGR